MGTHELELVRQITLDLPGVTERRSHGAQCFFVNTTRALCYFHDNHRGDGRVSVWCPVPMGVVDELVDSEPDRYFRPEPSGRGAFSSWVGLFVDGHGVETDWDEVAALVDDAYREVAPGYLIAELDAERGSIPE